MHVCGLLLLFDCPVREWTIWVLFAGSIYACSTQVFGISNVLSTELTSLFPTVSYFTPILGAYVADVYLGRFVLFIWVVHERSFHVDIRIR